MQKYIFYLFFMIIIPGYGQELRLDIELPVAAGKEIYLAQHYLGNIYAKDTLQLDSLGSGTFMADSLLPQGLYKIYLDQDRHFDFLLGSDQQFKLKNKSFQTETMEVEGAAETAEFVAYTLFLKILKEKDATLKDKMGRAEGEEKERLKDELDGLNGEVKAYRQHIEEKLPGSFLGKFIMANHVPSLNVSTLPDEVQHNDSLLARTQFYYQQEHFWDHFDYTDERFIYTPFYKNRLETWFTKVLVQSYDSVKQHVFRFIEEVKPQKRIFQFVTSYFLNSSINSNIMGMDALFVDLARKYYFSGEAFWATEESLAKIRENVLFAENNLIGQTAPDLTLESYSGEYFNLYQVEAKYTLVLLYEPGCSHCNAFVPALYSEVYQPFKDKGLKVFAIYTMNDREAWGEFLTRHDLFDWINVWDEYHVSRFKILYDARKTPGIYVLDENKTIVAKKLTVEQIKMFLESNLTD